MTRVSLPASTDLTARSWPGRKSGYPNRSRRMARACSRDGMGWLRVLTGAQGAEGGRRSLPSATVYDGVMAATSRQRTEGLDGAGEVAAREFIAHEGSHGLEPCWPRGGEIIEHAAVPSDDRGDGLVRHVEDRVIAAYADVPQAGNILAPLERTRMQQSIPTVRIGRDGERVAGRVGDLHHRMLLHTEIAAARRHTLVGRGEHAVLDRHSLGTSVHEHV